MKLFCEALASERYIPAKYSSKGVAGGQNISPPLSWTDIPNGTKSFALSMIDRHPSAKGAAHWVVINMSANSRSIGEGASRNPRRLPPGSFELRNDFGDTGYSGPRPLKGSGSHEYLITLYALNTVELQLGPVSLPGQFQSELSGKVLGIASLIAKSG
jgi:Raf kinase inhibitor-like YbhB/YbcL family protein